MVEETLAGIQRDLGAYRAEHPGLPGTVGHRPASVALHPATWYAIAVGMTERPTFTFEGPAGAAPTLYGMRVVEDETLAPGTWRLEH